jgi:predicted permease
MKPAIRQFMTRLFPWFRRRWSDADLGDEIHAHLDLLTDAHVRRGMSLSDARAAARRDFGGLDQVKEQYRDQRALPFVDAFAQDLRYALRTFRKSPGFVTAVVLSLATGIGVTSVVFTALNALMLMSLPVRNAGELFHFTPQVTNAAAAAAPTRFSYEAFTELRRAAPDPLTVAAMSRVARMYRREEGRRELVPTTVQLVSGEYFPVLGISAFLGRTLGPADNLTPGAHPVAVMSHAMWTQTFGADHHIVGRTLTVNGQSLTVVGVVPAGFSGVWLESPIDLWVPLMMQQEVRYRQNYSASDSRPLEPWIPQDGIRWLDVIGRRPPGDGGRMAAALKAAYDRRLNDRVANPATRERLRRQGIELQPFSQGFSNVRGNFGLPLYALFGMAAVILLIACANAANLLLARASARRREIAVRLSIGASRWRVVRQLLTESALLAAVSCGLGLLVSESAANLLVRRALGGAARFAVHVDARVVLFAIGAALLTVALTGLAPALRSTGAPAGLALYVVSGASARVVAAQPRLQKLLVAGQVALSLVLVVAAGLFVQTLRNYSRMNLGFTQEHVVTVPLNLASIGYPRERIGQLSRALVERLEAVPGVTSASTAMCQLVAGCRSRSDVVIEGYQAAPDEIVQVQENRVSLEYFTTTGMRVVEGRAFDSTDRENTRPVAIVNRAMARRFFDGASPIGKRFGYTRPPNTEIVGVVDDARVNRVQEAASPMAFYPMTQNPEFQIVDIRTAGNPRDVVNEIHRAISGLLPDIPMGSIMLLSDQVDSNLNQERLIAALTSIFGTLALALASLGLFGVMSYAVTQRTAEFGIRLALGASRTRVLSAVLRESLLVVGVGLAVGVAAVFGAARLLVALLFGVSGTDLSTLIAALAVLTTIGAIASAVPAWRAARVDPMVALRHE